MKKFRRFLFILILISWNIILIESWEFTVEEHDVFHEHYPKSSSFHNLTGNYMETYIYENGDILTGETQKIIASILIDDTLENYTWIYINNTYPWCSGAGTPEDPYIIDNVYIDGLYMSNTYIHYSNILIRHSRAYFIIQNCSIHKNGKNERGSVFFYNVTNGILQDNELTLNGNAIHLFESHDFLIRDNYVESIIDQYVVGTGKAIWCDGYGNGNGSCNNTIQNNTIINHYDGIVAHFSVNLNITKNFLNNTLFGHYPDTGVYLANTNYSFITYNTFAGDYAEFLEEGQSIITQENCVGNNVSNAFIIVNGSLDSSSLRLQQGSTWFSLIDSNYNYLYGNIIFKLVYTPPETPETIGVGNLLFLISTLAIVSLMIIGKQKRKIN